MTREEAGSLGSRHGRIAGFFLSLIITSIGFIWALNALFNLGIPFTAKTIFAGMLIRTMISSAVRRGLDVFVSAREIKAEMNLS